MPRHLKYVGKKKSASLPDGRKVAKDEVIAIHPREAMALIASGDWEHVRREEVKDA